METRSKSTNPDTQIEKKLRELLSLTRTNANGSPNKACLRRVNSNNIAIGFDNDENGKADAVRFLNKLNIGGFIDNDNLKKSEDAINNSTITSQPLSQSLNITTDNNIIVILFNHQSNYKSANAGLEKAIESVKKDREEYNQLENKWILSPPSDAELIVERIRKKLESVAPDRNPEITYSATENAEYKFQITFSTDNRKIDLMKVNKLLEKLNNNFKNNGKAEILQNDDPNRIGFIVAGQPEKLLPHFNKFSFINIFNNLFFSNSRQ